jgi:hypothetical protein
MMRRHLLLLTTWAVLFSLLTPGALALAQDETPPGSDVPPPALMAAPQAAPSSGPDGAEVTPATAFFLHVATAANTSNHITTIDHPATNDNPSALVFVTSNWNPGGIDDGTYNDRAVGVWYSGGKWKIFNQDLAAMPANAAFNVMVVTGSSNAFVHQTNAANTAGNSTSIQSPLTDGRPNALLFITPNYNAGPVYNIHPTNVWYFNAGGRWQIGNQNGVAMPVGMAYNVLVLDAAPNAFVHRANAANTGGHVTRIDNPLTNNRPNRFVFTTQNWNPGGGGGTYNPRHIGIYYFDSKMRIFNQNSAPMPANAAFNVFVPTADTGAFVHRAAAGNITGNNTTIDNPLTNGKPFATLFATANYNPNGAGGTYNDHPIGVYYFDGKWRVFNQDFAAMPANAAFNILAPEPGVNVFVHKATAANTVGNASRLDHPLTNGNPNALLLVTPNWNPGGAGGTYNNHPVGVYYIAGGWNLTNQDGGAIEPNASFNIMVLPASSGAFVHTATPANTAAQVTRIDNARTNGNQHALVFTTLNWNPGGVGGTYNNHVTGVYYINGRWSVFNQDIAAMPANASFNVYIVASRTYLPAIMR